MRRTQKRDGFQGQIHYSIPRPMIASAGQHILVSGIYPTGIGYYPQAANHHRQREEGAEQNILIICTAGQGWFELDGRRRTLRSGQALLIPKSKPHAYGASQRNPWTIQWLHFTGEDASYYITLMKSGYTLNVHHEIMPKIERLFADVYGSFSGGFNQQNMICASQIIRHLLGLLFFNNKAFSPAAVSIAARKLEPVVRYMRKHLDQSLTVGQMARQAGLSAPHFSRLFRQEVGFSPMEYFIHLKIQRACRLLTLTSLRVKEIGSRLGYSDQYYFSRIFHKIMGISPAAYRRGGSAAV